MLRQAGKLGAKIIEETKVSSLVFEGDPATTRPIAAKWTNTDGQSGTIGFEYLVDASGRRGIMSTTYLMNRQFNEGLRNIAFWGYWKGTGKYKPGTDRENAPYAESLEGGLRTLCHFKKPLAHSVLLLTSRRVRVGMVHPTA